MKFFLEKPIKKVISKKKHPVENLWKTFLLLSSNKKIFFLFEKIFV